MKRANINFKCYINVLRVRQVNPPHIVYQYPLQLKMRTKRQKITKFEWKIDARMMRKFRECEHGQRFESKIFDSMWNLSCFLNENKSKNNLKKGGKEDGNIVIG